METTLNIELFKKVRDKIAATPEAYDQSVFARHSSIAPCGTAACIAGWACVLSGAMDSTELIEREDSGGELFDSIASTARMVLGINEDEASILFTPDPDGVSDAYGEVEGGWPEPFRGRWEDAISKKRPAIAVAYLNRIIKTGKVAD